MSDTDPLPAPVSPPLVLVINRFDDEFGEYHRFLPGGTHRLAYLTTEDGLPPLDRATAVETVVVPDLEYATLLPHARRIAETHGPLAGIVGPSEFDLLTAARLRSALGVPGWTLEYVTRFRDKTVMKRWVTFAGLRAPRYLALDADATAGTVLDPGSGLPGLPLILKPRDGAASRGVRLVRTEAELAAALAEIGRESLPGYEAEEYVEGRIHHVDGIRTDGRFHFASVSEYVNTCLDFTGGTPLGSVLLDRGPLHEQLSGFAADCLDALELWDGPFHLELILPPSGEPVFLEVGLRPGGAGVPFVHRDLFGIDLYCEAVRTAVGLPPLTDEAALRRVEASGGWLVFPEPRPLPARVAARGSLLGEVPEVYAEALPAVGHVFDGDGGYDHAGGRFLLRGAGQAAVRRAVHEAVARYRLVAEPAAVEVGA
ncbi:acetyl-CoA carboxylase biotin carboxylase subunit family protein [Streptomyces sp. NPDC059629]|uniref:ATP-grasp domain-containing protein n=1 Tax=Streptomyces sp. NPDC059629 TaxID=3346889 RepID=UPI00368633F9